MPFLSHLRLSMRRMSSTVTGVAGDVQGVAGHAVDAAGLLQGPDAPEEAEGREGEGEEFLEEEAPLAVRVQVTEFLGEGFDLDGADRSPAPA